MKKSLFLYGLLALFVLPSSYLLRAQTFSEAHVTFSDKGERLSQMIYVKWKTNGIIEIPSDKQAVDGNAISNKYQNIKKVISEFCKNRQIDLASLKISKVFNNAKDADTIFIDYKKGEIKKLPNLSRVFIVEFPKIVDIETIIYELKKQNEVEYTHGPVQLINCAEYPSDQYYSNGGQWYLNTLDAPNAWGITKGSTDIKIALIETSGVELTHSDLQVKIIGGDNNPANIGESHGTSVAGFAGAVTNNGTTGVASVGWNAKLLTYKPTNDDGNRTVLAQKIKDAADAGAHVINLSFKTYKDDFTSCSTLNKTAIVKNQISRIYYYYNWSYSLVEDAINYALGKDIVVIASAGNSQDIYGNFSIYPCEVIPYPCYPAQYPGVIAVSGSQQNNNFVDGWNYGSFIDVNAPGRTDASTGLWSTDLNSSYTNSSDKTSGTSFSAPQVSAIAALIKSLKTTLTPAQVKTILENSADKVGQYSYSSGRNDYFGYGRVNAYKALKYTIENYGGTFNQNVTLPAGDTWNLQPGVTLTFASGCALIVNGTLNAVGNSTSRITFTKSGTSNWGGIQFNSGSSGSINYATVSYAAQGIYIQETNALSINNTEISNCSGHGIYVYRTNYATQPVITNCNIHDNPNSTGIVMYWSSPDIRSCNLYNNYNGLGIADYSSPRLGHTSVPGNNNIHNNSNIGVYSRRYSDPLLGRNLSPLQAGNNIIASNTYKEAQAENYCYVYAENNWWGSAPPNSNKITAISGSTIDYDPYLFSPPSLAVVLTDEFANSSAIEKRIVFIELPVSTKQELLLADDLSTDTEISSQISQLNSLWRQARETDLKSFKACLKNLSDKKEKQTINAAAKLILAGYEKEKRIGMLEEVILDYDKQPITETALMSKFLYYFNELKDYKSASGVLEVISQKFPQSSVLQEVQQHMSLLDLSIQSSKNEVQQHNSSKQVGGVDDILENYPNPFNPSTKVSFTLKDGGKVSLKVYDVLGKEVANLAEGYYEAGKHVATFNGSNLASGIYFYRLVTPSATITKKMMMMK